ncbi:MAG: peptidoglycan-binding protein, partial [Gammaproteobacteria bacterium]|nr:peptidoglycan-binding protein [Gammaproteobacteria bacterium]
KHYKRNKQRLFPLAAVASVLIIGLAVFAYYRYSTENADVTARQTAAAGIENKPAAADTDADMQPAIANLPAEQTSTGPAPDKQQAAINDTARVPGTAVAETLNAIEPQPAIASADETLLSTNADKYDDINAILADASSNPVSAFETLFKAWGIQYNINASIGACQQAEAYALSCLYKLGNLNSLKRHNRPAILTLTNSQGKKRYLTITSIDNDHATVVSNNRTYTIRSGDLDKFWYGKFILLWRKPDHYSSVIKPGDRGSIVNWLNMQLTKINGSQPAVIAHTYDSRLVKQVRTFQIQQGLTADGIVGPVTIIHLNIQSGMQGPILVPAPAHSVMEQN